MRLWIIAALGCLLGNAAQAESYRTTGSCGGFPGVQLQTPAGLCVGLVAQGLGHARGVAVRGHDVFVLDLGGWEPGRGRLLRLGHDGQDKPEVLLTGLDEPSALALAPDGSLYAGVLGRVARVELDPPRLVDVVVGLPGTGRHPLPALAFGADGAMYVNVGSGTDHCEGAGRPAQTPCPETQAHPPRASVLRVVPGTAPMQAASAEVVATGLRNSMALTVLPGDILLAAVNGRDAINRADPSLQDATLPHDTLHVVARGADYGWPYCFDDRRANPEYAGHDCSATQRPALLLPPHAAPLGMLRYEGQALPGLRGRLVLAYHGYRSAGHRIVSLGVMADGKPDGAPEPLVWGWEAAPGSHPQGSPVSVASMPDGTLLITEDHNGTLLRLAPR